jgi:3'(2'), 5'-bisphosphate nucleotidase
MDSGTGLDPDAVAAELGRIAVEAGRLLAEVADRAGGRRVKEDGSPTTDADLASERLILSALARAWPDIPVVAEESVDEAVPGHLFFLVDPLDGTRDYLGGAGEYSVNIALVSGDRPVAAGICAPSDGRVWIAGSRTAVAPMSDLRAWSLVRVRPAPAEGPTALVSRRHGDPDTEACLHAAKVALRRTASSAYKFCLIASGEADLYLRCGPDHGVGRRGRRPHPQLRRRHRDRRGSAAAHLRACRARLPQRPLRGAWAAGSREPDRAPESVPRP